MGFWVLRVHISSFSRYLFFYFIIGEFKDYSGVRIGVSIECPISKAQDTPCDIFVIKSACSGALKLFGFATWF